MLVINAENKRFSFRVAGLAIHKNKVLSHRYETAFERKEIDGSVSTIKLFDLGSVEALEVYPSSLKKI